MTDTVRVPKEIAEAWVKARRAIQATPNGLSVARDCIRSEARLSWFIEAALAASLQGEGSLADAQSWRDIATAPRDGSLILCFYPDRHGHDRYSLRYWATGDWGARSEGWSDQHRQLRKTEPAHWMPLPPLPSAHPAPIKPSGDTGELRERVALEIRNWPFDINHIQGCLELADAILDLIQTKKAG